MTDKKRGLSKRDTESRLKLIQELNYNKSEQKIFDESVTELPYRYTEIYNLYRRGVVFSFMGSISMRRLSKAMLMCGVTAQEGADAVRRFTEASLNIESDYQ